MFSSKAELKMEKIGLIIFLFLVSSLLVRSIKADILPTPFLQEGDIKDDYGYSIVQTTDGGYAIAGYTLSSGSGGKDFLLVKTDGTGNLQWSVTYGGKGDEIAYSVIQTSSGDYLVAGTTTSWTKGETDCLLVKVNNSGKVVDNRTYGGIGYDVIYEIIEDAPFYALAGWTNFNAVGGNDFWFLKLDSDLNEELSRTYGGQFNDIAESIVAIGGGSYVIAGYSYSYGTNGDLWCIRIDSYGNITAELTHGESGQDGGRSIITSRGGGYAIAGYKSFDENNVCDFWLVKVDTDLQVEYEQVFGDPSLEERAWSIVQMEDEGYVLAGYAYSDIQKYDVMIVKTESDTYSGFERWLKKYDGSENEIAECVILPKDDSGIVISGYTSSYGKGNDFLLLKTSTNGVGQWSATYGTVISSQPNILKDYWQFIAFGVASVVIVTVAVRFRQKIKDILGFREKIQVLFLAANPAESTTIDLNAILNTSSSFGSTPLDLNTELNAIEDVLDSCKFRDRFNLEQRFELKPGEIAKMLLKYDPHIVHFSGHGSEAGEIILQDENGQARPVDASAISNLFSVLKGNIRCVVLNACYTKVQAKFISKYVDCVIGMSKAIGDKAAIQFAEGFYRGLGFGKDLETAFNLGCAEIDLEGLDEEDTPKIIWKNDQPQKILFT